MSTDKVDSGQDGRLNESIEELKAAYLTFISHVGTTVKLKELLSADKLTAYPHLADLPVPQVVKADEDELELNKQRHKRLKASLDNCLNLINSKVTALEDEIMDELANMQTHYELVHMMFLLSSMYVKAQQLYVNNDECIMQLVEVEQKLKDLSIPVDLRLSYAMANSSSTIKHQKLFEELFWNFKENLIYSADLQADCRIKIGTYFSDAKHLRLTDIESKYELRMSPAFLE